MTPRERDEYRALRATIRSRGTARVCVFLAGLGIWAGLAIATAALLPVPSATLIPLVLLAGVFESVFALHVGVERVGRYLQVFHDDGWERTAMAFGPPLAGTGSDPLFVILFGVAAFLNFLPVLVAGSVPTEFIVVGAAHALFLGRLVIARQAVRGQRTADLQRFEELRRASSQASADPNI
jgi:hypothetical protein